MIDNLRRFEWFIALSLTLVLVTFHVIAATSMGGLWRDEANTLALATLPTLKEVWRNLQYDSFPLLWFLILRGFTEVFGAMNDGALRVLGFTVGLGVIGALWLNARVFRHTFPFFSLMLLALSPSVIVWGDSMRAYGLGMLLILVACAMLWRFVESPTRFRFALAAIAVVCAVHALFYNSVLVLAFCSGAVAVCVRRRAWKKAALVVLIGALAAGSLAPYLLAMTSWTSLIQADPYTLSIFFGKIEAAVNVAGPLTFVLWCALIVSAMAAGAMTLFRRQQVGVSEHQRDVVLFGGTALIVGIGAYYAFLKILNYPTQPWYYLSLLTLAAVTVDAVLGSMLRSFQTRAAALGCVILVFVLSFPSVRVAVDQRMTNLDLIAGQLNRMVTADDLVLIDPWYCGISFARYYNGPAEWMTVPPVSDHRTHRLDLIKDLMVASDQSAPVRPVIDRIAETLQSGNRVFLVGTLNTPPPDVAPVLLPPAPFSKSGWNAGVYTVQWSSLVAFFVRQHAVKARWLGVTTDRPSIENREVTVIEGWRVSGP